MKKTFANTGIWYVSINLFLSIVSFVTAYAFCVSAANEDKWFPSAIFLLLMFPGKGMISEKNRRIAIASALAAGAVAAVIVISQVGIWILNIRYFAVVYNVAVGVMAAVQIVMYAAERKNIGAAA